MVSQISLKATSLLSMTLDEDVLTTSKFSSSSLSLSQYQSPTTQTHIKTYSKTSTKMPKAWLYEEHGPKEVLKLVDIPIPSPNPHQLLIKVHAAALNPIDSKLRQNPLIDLPVVPGCDMAGVVAARGGDTTRFQVGDEVYGNIQDFKTKLKNLGSLSQFIAVEEGLLASKPKNLSFEEAASLPLALQTAIEGFKTASFEEGQSVFIVGGAGGVGTLAVQLAKRLYKASLVTATCSSKKVEFVKRLGADKVIDYTNTTYKQVEEKYDLVFDTIGDSLKSCVVAKEGGEVIDITWPPSNPKARFSSLTVCGEVLEKIRPFLESGEVKAVVDPIGPFHFSEVIRAFGYIETGRAWGKVVVSNFSFDPYPSSAHIN